MQPANIVGFGSHLPRLMHDNQTLPPLDEPLEQKEIDAIGVYRRGWATNGEGVLEMAAEASRRALERAGMAPTELDVIILANWTERRYIPEFAPRLQQVLGAPQSFGFDVCCACAGFLYGIAMAHSLLQNPRWSRALVVASEVTSRRARPGSKATLILGDAAGAFVLERGATRGGRLIDYELASEGEHADIMDISKEGHVRTHIPQRELNALAGRSFGAVTSRLLQRNGVRLEDVRWIVPHSGTAGVQRMVAQTLAVPPGKILTNFASVGNVSSASIPTALDELVTKGTIKPGDLILSAAVGTGWYSAAMLYTL